MITSVAATTRIAEEEIAKIEMSWLGDLLIEPFGPFLLAKNGAESAGILTDR